VALVRIFVAEQLARALDGLTRHQDRVDMGSVHLQHHGAVRVEDGSDVGPVGAQDNEVGLPPGWSLRMVVVGGGGGDHGARGAGGRLVQNPRV
jgi:hypothetical protein